MAATAPKHNSAAAFVLQASPWAPLVIRSGSSADVSVEIPLHDDDDHASSPRVSSHTSAIGVNAPCLVWQFRIDEYDIKFQLLENGQPLEAPTRYAADGLGSPTGNDTADPATAQPTTTLRRLVSNEEPVSAEGVVAHAKRGALYTFRWDNAYSILRQKRVHYRFVMTSARAYAAAETAASETRQRAMSSTSVATSAPVAVKPHLAKRLALERRLTMDEVSLEQTRAIEQLQRCVTDMVSAFMTDPDRPLHEGSIREFILALEAVLRNGIKEKYLISAWPEEPYFEFLLQIGVVLRDDKGLIDEVNALGSADKLQYLGWTRARALLLLALNKNMLHYAFDNLIKRRSVVEAFYDNHGLLYMYSSATQIVAYLSALNGVKFLLAPIPHEDFLNDIVLPPNLRQCAPNDDFDGEHAIVVRPESERQGTGYVLPSGNPEDPDEMKTIQQCSVARNVLAATESQEMTISRGMSVSLPIPAPQSLVRGKIHLLLQLRVTPGDIVISIFEGHESDEKKLVFDPITVDSTDGWVDIAIITTFNAYTPVALQFDNSNAMMRARQVVYRMKSITGAEFDAAWESCQGVAQSISWKVATKAGLYRCQQFMEQLRMQQQHEVAEQQQRSREESGSNDADNDADADDSLFGMVISKPVSYLVGGFLGSDTDGTTVPSCSQCLSPFSFFSRQYSCPSCQSTVCIPCSRHTAPINGKGPQVKLCDRCFIKEKDIEKKRRVALSNGDGSSGGECAAYAALREDSSMDKYFKMLGFGVPHSGVAQKMLQDEMPSEKIVVFSAGPSGAVEEASQGATSSQRRSSDARLATTGSGRGNSFRKVHWKSLESKKASTSIWNRTTSRKKTAPIRISPQDYQEVVRLFAREAVVPGSEVSSGKGNSKKGGRVFSALDSRRSNNISIGLSQFKAAGGAEAIISSLKSCDFGFLTADRLANIYDIAPTSIEAKRYTNFRGSRARLEASEKFLVDMCDIPRVTEKIAAMRFVAQFDSQYRELRHRIKCITQACYQILQSERLARCFELVLAIGNLLNAGTEIENADGVTLESLLKLSETKSFDQSMTLLHFIVRLIHDRGEGDVLLFIQELSAIAEAKRFSNVICLSQAKTLQSGVTQAQSEIKEEMLLDTKRFEKEEQKRRAQFEQAVELRQTKHDTGGSQTNASSETPQSSDPRAALNAMIQKRNTSPATDPRAALNAMIRSQNSSESGDANAAPDPRAALNAMIRQRASQTEPTQIAQSSSQPNGATPSPSRPAFLAEIQSRKQPNLESTEMAKPARSDLLAAIRQKSVTAADDPKSSESSTTAKEVAPERPRMAFLSEIKRRSSVRAEEVAAPAAPSSANRTGARPPVHRPPVAGLPQGDLLAAIRSRRPQNGSVADLKSGERDSSAGAEFVPRAYSVDDNAFIKGMRARVLSIKAMIEELEMDVETLVSVWESTARYLGEDPSGSSSEYVLQLLHRFILDVKIAKSLLSRQGLSFRTTGLNVQVGCTVATLYGPGVVTAIRGTDTKLEVAFPWSREAYLAPSSVLSVGAIVRCEPFGVGILRSTHYDRGFCSIRFRFGFGIVRVRDVMPDSSSSREQFKQLILANGFRIGDPVTTPFGCGSVRSVPKHQPGQVEGYVAVTLLSSEDDDSDDEQRFKTRPPVAFVQRTMVNMNY